MTMCDKVYIVTVSDCESSWIVSVHKTMEGTRRAWEVERVNLIAEYKHMIEALNEKETDYDWNHDEMYIRMIENLQCSDPEEIDNYPHETPNILTYEVVE